MVVNKRLLLPYLMGQRRDGLRRVLDIDPHPWEVLGLALLHETRIDDPVEKLHNLGSLYALLAARVAALARSGCRPVSLAGDCVSSLGMLAGLQQAGQPPDRVLWLDAHGDFHTWSSTGTQYIGGMPLAMFVGRVDPGLDARRRATLACLSTIGVQAYPQRQIVLADARDLDPGEREALLNSGIVRCPLVDVLGHLQPHERIYLHWDTDVIDDPARMPALKYHVRRGPSAADMAALFQALRSFNIVAVSVSAWHAEQDGDNRTALACLEILDTLLGASAAAR
jgi:arginase